MDFTQAFRQVKLSLGVEISPEREAAFLVTLLPKGYTAGEVKIAASALCTCPVLDDKLRYGGTLTPADFRRMIEPDEAAAKAGKLYAWHEAMAMWTKAGEPVPFPGSMFEWVDTDDGKRLRLK